MYFRNYLEHPNADTCAQRIFKRYLRAKDQNCCTLQLYMASYINHGLYNSRKACTKYHHTRKLPPIKWSSLKRARNDIPIKVMIRRKKVNTVPALHDLHDLEYNCHHICPNLETVVSY